jgi:diguanylate cyclase (GGDEF)-like protein
MYLSKARDCRNKLEEFQALLDLGEMHCVQGKDESAIFYLQQALILEQEQVSYKGRVKCHELLAELYLRQGNLESAFTHLNQSKSFLELLFNQETAKKIAGLQVIHQIESSRRAAKIFQIKNDELKREIEERKKAQAIAEQFAITDPLTGLFNRRHFFYLAEREMARAIRNKRPISVIMLDLDHFKRVNDTYGHAMGDRVLSEAAIMIRDNLRAIDIIGRYGGEEFVILLPETDIFQAEQIAERIRNSTTQRPFGTSEQPVFVSISLGVASLYQNEDMEHPTIDMLLNCADKALYVAKQNGRDQTAVFRYNPEQAG